MSGMQEYKYISMAMLLGICAGLSIILADWMWAAIFSVGAAAALIGACLDPGKGEG